MDSPKPLPNVKSNNNNHKVSRPPSVSSESAFMSNYSPKLPKRTGKAVETLGGKLEVSF